MRRLAVLILCFCILLISCGGPAGSAPKTIVLTTGFETDEVFRIDSISCYLPEVLLYMTNIKNQCELVFGNMIWDRQIDGESFEDRLKDNVLARIAQIKTMNLYAKDLELSLDDDERNKAAQCAVSYYESLSGIEKSKMRVDSNILTAVYSEYALANKLYQYLVKDVNTEISDDEARTVTVQQILLRTYHYNSRGGRIDETGDTLLAIKQKAQLILDELENGADFSALCQSYNEAEQDRISFARGAIDEATEAQAFDLGLDQISDPVVTPDGIRIMKCVSTSDSSQIESTKERLVRERKKAVFDQNYNKYLKNLTKNINLVLWENTEFIDDENVDTSSFFEIYDQVFKLDNLSVSNLSLRRHLPP